MSMWNDARQLTQWFERTKGDRTTWESTWQEIADNEFGRRDFTTTRTPGEDRSVTLYDTTALYANQLLAGTLHGLLANPMSVWFELRVANRSLWNERSLRVWLEDCRNRLLISLASGPSRFTSAMAELFLDVSGFGTSGIWIEADPKVGVRFSCRPLRELFLEEGPTGEIDVIFREVELTARQFAIRFPKPKEEFPEVERALEKNAQEKFKIVQLITRSDDPQAGTSPFRKEWTGVCWMYDRGKRRIIEQVGYDEKPILTPRWSVESGHTYGYGPGNGALADAKMLNVMQKTILKAAQKAADPPLLVSDQGVLRGIRTAPGGVNYVQDRPGIGGQPDAIRPLQNNARVDIGIELIDRKIQGVRNAYWAQLLQLYEDPRMTATQVLALTSKAQTLMSPITGRQQVELLDPVIARAFGVMLRGGWFLPPPPLARGQSIEVHYVSPIAASQRAQEAQALMQAWELAALIAQASQTRDGLDHLDPQVSTRLAAEALAVPQRAIRDIREVQQLQAARAEMAQQEQMLAQAGAGAEIVEKMGKAIGSVQDGGQRRAA